MFEIKKKPSFSNISKLLKQSDAFAGLYFLQDPPKNITLKIIIQHLTRSRFIVTLHLMAIGTLITSNFTLISIIFCSTIISICYTVNTACECCKRNRKTVIEFVEWCEGLYDIKKKFHPSVQSLAEKKIVSIEKQTMKVVKLFRAYAYGIVFVECFLFIILELFLPENILPKYTPPMPLYLPFENQKTWMAFFVTCFAQTIMYLDTTTLLVDIFNIFLTLVSHFYGFLDLIDEYAKEIGQKMKLAFDTERKRECQSELESPTLDCIDACSDDGDDIPFEELMKVVTEMISDVNHNLTAIRKIGSITLFTLEISTLASLFICGLIFTIVHQQYAFGICVLISTTIFALVCFINEKILDKFSDIKETLYDIPWYGLKPKERKTLLLVLNCDLIQKGFTAAGIHDLTMERFGIVVKAGYTNMLVLKDIVNMTK